MSPKNFEKLIHVNYSDNNQVTTRMVFADFRDFQTPLEKLLNKSLHGFGVAAGLEVTATADAAGVQVAAGVAIDRSGQILVLSTGGAAVIGNQAPFTETTVPVVVPTTDELKGKKVVVCMQFNELSRIVIPLPGETNDFPNGKLEQAPIVTLVPVSDFTESEFVVVLGVADIDADGKVTAVVSGAAPGRQRLSPSVGQLNIERPEVDSAKELIVGTLGPIPAGNGLQLATELTSITGKLAVSQSVAERNLDVAGSVAVRQVAQGPELVVLSQTPGGAGGIETRDINNKRMAALTTTGSGANQAGYLAVGTSSGVEVASVSASAEGSGHIQVQSHNGQAAVVITADGVSDDGLVKVLSNSVNVVTLGADGITSKGDINCDGKLQAAGALLNGTLIAKFGVQTDGSVNAKGFVVGNAGLVTNGSVQAAGAVSSSGNLHAQGALFATGGAVGTAGLWTDGNVQAKGAVFADGNVQAKGALIATGGAVGTAGLWTDKNVQAKGAVFADGNVQAKGALIATGGAVGTAGLWTDGNVQAKGTIFADGNVQSKGTVFADRNVQAKGTIFADGNVQAKGDVFGKAKHFVMPHPNDVTKDIVYGCVEGPEAAAYIRGRAYLTDGRAWIELPEHFMLVINSDTATIQLTPRSAASKGLAAVEFGLNGFAVQELFDGTGSYDFDYFVTGVRKGYENYQPVVDSGMSPIAQLTPPMFAAGDVSIASAITTPSSSPQMPPVPTSMDTPSNQPIAAPSGTVPGEKPEPWNIL